MSSTSRIADSLVFCAKGRKLMRKIIAEKGPIDLLSVLIFFCDTPVCRITSTCLCVSQVIPCSCWSFWRLYEVTAFTSPIVALMITATRCIQLYRSRPVLQNANAFLIPTFVRLCVVAVSEAAVRAMLLAEESRILPALLLPRVFSVLLMLRHYSRLSGERRRKAKRRRKFLAAKVLSACFLLPRSA